MRAQSLSRTGPGTGEVASLGEPERALGQSARGRTGFAPSLPEGDHVRTDDGGGRRMMRTRSSVAAVALVGTLAGCGAAAAGSPGAPQPRAFSQPIYDAGGQSVGQLTLTQQGRDSVRVTVESTRLPPGVHGTHLHTTGRCDPPGFTTAGGHLNPAARQHGMRNPAGPHLG